ncbi:gamma-glutamylcyclotransferase (GGCT)/AIG2-like uncharacterized protein YtfP [Flavobacterium sp. HSC-32F16]|uniref:gamma-glutamylcyclotransferase family protein n=1 Tax=Flavobacterium sp. HSC-32F16 TaxID=2910964 RepID=UPI0020A57D38|nr:gamma-glutamylcyclotransferase [Flavobacterium sp. HSC-32F16]MCP2027532.1 gamma-glutamylcyclotransferase (GGCT)/AIG2-like uncharacterized protein YtfP [Flavobacterium sp. HSC-32F16]
MSNLESISALIIYGSLAPGESNHSIMDSIKGDWQKAAIRGKLQEGGWGSSLGYHGFIPVDTQEAETINCYVLFSKDLLSHWDYLDEFEGDGYTRIQTEYELENGKKGIGFIYALNQ